VKILNQDLIGQQSSIDRFYREGRSGSILEHPNIVRTFLVGQDKATSRHYLVMEYVDGPSAQTLLGQRGPLSVGDAVHLALQVARGLEHAHSRNIIHRDIKPDNILLNRSGVAKLADMGLARRTDDPTHLTAVRQGFGTTAYMPYEQAINARAAERTQRYLRPGCYAVSPVDGSSAVSGRQSSRSPRTEKTGTIPSG
jgi:serine/threonine-protein kinase